MYIYAYAYTYAYAYKRYAHIYTKNIKAKSVVCRQSMCYFAYTT